MWTNIYLVALGLVLGYLLLLGVQDLRKRSKKIDAHVNESNLVAHARRELNLIHEDPDVIEWYLDVVRAFTAYGHSGGSAMATIPVINELLQYNALSPLTDDPAEWHHHGPEMFSDGGVWQNKRDSRAFSEDGGKTYYLVSEGAHHGKPTTRHTSLVTGLNV